MILYEIEDMVTNEKGLVQFVDQVQADRILMEKGFDCLERFEFYAGLSIETGNEISVMKATGVPYWMVKDVTGKIKEQDNATKED